MMNSTAPDSKDFFAKLSGDWKGTYTLYMRPTDPVSVSDINAQVKPVALNNYFVMNYDWQHDSRPQEGVFLFAGQQETASFSWGDSFHSVPEPMQCKGTWLDTDSGPKLIFHGSFSVGDGIPEWGWRTEFYAPDKDSFIMEAFVVKPEGAGETRSVLAEMKRVVV